MATVVDEDVRETKPRTRRSRKPKPEPAPRGLVAAQLASGTPPPQVTDLRRAVEQDGGWVLGTYRDPVGGHWQILAALPLERVEPTPFQRDLSEGHVARLERAIDKMDRFLDPIIVVRSESGIYWTPNGHHRTAALRRLGGRAIVALLVPEAEVAYQILALNTEKAHNLREKSLEAVRMARALAESDPRAERDFALEFEEPAFLTLGLCYEQNGSLRGRRLPLDPEARGRVPAPPRSRRRSSCDASARRRSSISTRRSLRPWRRSGNAGSRARTCGRSSWRASIRFGSRPGRSPPSTRPWRR